MNNQETGCILTTREIRTLELYGEYSAREIGQRFGTSPDAQRMRAYRARRKCPARRVVFVCPRVRCASQVGSASAPLNLDSLN